MAKKSDEARQLAAAFSVLSDETRIRLMQELQSGGQKNVTDLCKALDQAQPTVSHHLGLLRMNGLVENQRKGKQIFYAIKKDQFAVLGKNIGGFLTVPLAKRAKKAAKAKVRKPKTPVAAVTPAAPVEAPPVPQQTT